MQTLGRVAIIGGTVLVALVNIIVFADSENHSKAAKAAIYLKLYEWALVIPLVSVLGVVLASLLRALNTVDGIEWIRMLYLYPTTIGDDVLTAMAESDKVCKYIDLPLQHAADSVLKRMKRPGTRALYERLLTRIRTTLPDVTLRTTFIVGYPGETEAEFEELLQFLREARLDRVGCFAYSPVEGARANGLPDPVPEEAKKERVARFMQVQAEISRAKLRAKVGRTLEVLVDEMQGATAIARSKADAPEIDGIVRVKSAYTIDETVARIKQDIAAKGIMFFSAVDQAKLASDAGIKLRPSTLLTFGNPPLGTQFITANPNAGLDWPVRLLVTQDDKGDVWAVYTDFQWIAQRHSITDRVAQFNMASNVIGSITASVQAK